MKLDKRLLDLVPQSKKWVRLTVLFNWLSLLAAIVSALVFGRVLQAAYEGSLGAGAAFGWALLLAAAFVLRGLFGKVSVFYSYRASFQIKHTLRLMLYRQLLKLYLAAQPAPSAVALAQAASDGVEQLEVFFGRYIPQFYYSLLAPLTLFAVLAWLEWPTALVMLLCVPLVPFSLALFHTVAKKRFRTYWSRYVNLGGRFLDNMQGLTTLKIYRDDGFQAQRMHEDAQSFREITMRVLSMQLNSVSILDMLAYGGAAVGMMVGAVQFADGDMTLAALVAFIILSVEFFLPMRLLGSFFHVAMQGLIASDNIFQVLNQEIPEHSRDCRELSAPFALSLKDVSFDYENGKPALRGVDAQIAAGSLTLLAGPSGSGKSTLVSLLMGLNRPLSGSVEVNGTAVADIAPDVLYRHFCLVSHHNYIFSGSLRDNLQMAKEGASDDEMFAVLEQVNLADFVRGNGGLDMKLYSRGANLSGGQMQRLALARGLLADADVYVFDEATSNIDIDSESLIFALIGRLKSSKTVVVVSHRLTSELNPDYVYVLEQGRVAEHGTAAELTARGGLYAEMAGSQAQLEQVYLRGAGRE